jgi:hypothetical protein
MYTPSHNGVKSSRLNYREVTARFLKRVTNFADELWGIAQRDEPEVALRIGKLHPCASGQRTHS